MGRLIDAGLVLDNLSGRLESMKDYDAVKDVINNMPTAYDPDKVVEQLEKYCFEKYCAEGDSDIERIVKGGGADLELECKWKLEEEGNLYVTECENRHIVFDGTPEENGYRYCPYCGRKIKEVD